MKQNTLESNQTDSNIIAMERTIESMEVELSDASFGGDRKSVPLLLKQLRETRRILAKMTTR